MSYTINNMSFNPDGDKTTVSYGSTVSTVSTDKARLMYREQQRMVKEPIASGSIVDFSDLCPQHNTEVKKEYSFGSSEDARVYTFSGCKCAIFHSFESTYHQSYKQASGQGKMQSARMSAW